MCKAITESVKCSFILSVLLFQVLVSETHEQQAVTVHYVSHSGKSTTDMGVVQWIEPSDVLTREISQNSDVNEESEAKMSTTSATVEHTLKNHTVRAENLLTVENAHTRYHMEEHRHTSTSGLLKTKLFYQKYVVSSSLLQAADVENLFDIIQDNDSPSIQSSLHLSKHSSGTPDPYTSTPASIKATTADPCLGYTVEKSINNTSYILIRLIMTCSSEATPNRCFFNQIVISSRNETHFGTKQFMYDPGWKNELNVMITGPGRVIIQPQYAKEVSVSKGCILLEKMTSSGLGGECNETWRCAPKYSVCDSGVCSCKENYIVYNGKCLCLWSAVWKIAIFVCIIIISCFSFIIIWTLLKRRQRSSRRGEERRTSINSIDAYVESRLRDRPPSYDDVEAKPPAYEEAVAGTNRENVGVDRVPEVRATSVPTRAAGHVFLPRDIHVGSSNVAARLMSIFSISGRRIFLRDVPRGSGRGPANSRATGAPVSRQEQQTTSSRR